MLGPGGYVCQFFIADVRVQSRKVGLRVVGELHHCVSLMLWSRCDFLFYRAPYKYSCLRTYLF